ncbi:hypothetical protein RhiirC2_858929 [Rhizophagus irregularis]|uniref:Uncharacterized protein n=1 Tax=Rhizophagus irregularis TaxID=588596 RepID=A0A2N1M228_9GLOM|nr:hypothetical protein RhiirC2_858929 [Rhizophagus irregularis]
MTITVHGHSASDSSHLVLHVLKELGLSYEFVQPNSFEEIKTPEYLATKHPLFTCVIETSRVTDLNFLSLL